MRFLCKYLREQALFKCRLCDMLNVLRHTFCTDMQRSLDVKVLQYVMGHSSVDITLNTYTHMSYENVKKAFNEAMGIG